MTTSVAWGLRVTPRARPFLAAAALVALLAAGIALLFFRGGPAGTTAGRAEATAALVQSLQRTTVLAGEDVRVLLATPAYFRVSGQEAVGTRYGADRDLVLLLREDVHGDDLPAPLHPVVRVDGRLYVPTTVEVVIDAVHHRASAITYRDPDRPLVDPRVETVEFLLGDAAEVALRWERPFSEPGEGPGAPSVAALLALLGGILASMWPCLFQLSAYFLPSVAGLSIDEANDRRAPRLPVLRTAILFVSGVVIVYTVAGAVAGFAAQSLASNAVFDAARRPLTLLAGLVVIAMALRLAVRARAPLVCRMPVMSLAGRFGGGPLGTVALGLAFATGCMTCFGAALVLGMFAYVVTAASPLVGAAILFLFSLGVAVPLVVAAIAMARVLPLLARLERGAYGLSLASAGIMSVYGLLLVTDSYHVVSDGLARALGVVR